MSGCFSIVPAKIEDLDGIWEIVRRTIAELNAKGQMNFGPHYPTKEIFKADIEKQELFLLRNNEEICGVVGLSLTHILSPAYHEVKFAETKREKWLYLARFFIDPKHQRKGLGHKTLIFVDQYSISKGLNAIRLEVYFNSVDKKLHELYERHGYELKRIVNRPELKFKNLALFEKILKQPNAKL